MPGQKGSRSGYIPAKPPHFKATKKALEMGEDFCVEYVAEGLYQSVFPTPLAHKSQLHSEAWDGWEYIANVILGKDKE